MIISEEDEERDDDERSVHCQNEWEGIDSDQRQQQSVYLLISPRVIPMMMITWRFGIPTPLLSPSFNSFIQSQCLQA